MRVESYNSYEELSRATADRIGSAIRNKPNSLVCIASGHTPIGVFKCLAEDINSGKLDASKVTFVSLDEWLGIDPTDPGSCISMLRKDFFDHVSVRIEMFDVNTNPGAECERINNLIAANGGLDVMLVGVGLNGHIGMNEPGTSFDSYAHVAELAEATKTTGQKYFAKPTTLSQGITLGLRHFSESKLPILMANGSKKAEIIGRIITTTQPTEALPATIVHKIPQALVLIDKAAGELI